MANSSEYLYYMCIYINTENVIGPKWNYSAKSNFRDSICIDEFRVRQYRADRKFNGHFMLKIWESLRGRWWNNEKRPWLYKYTREEVRNSNRLWPSLTVLCSWKSPSWGDFCPWKRPLSLSKTITTRRIIRPRWAEKARSGEVVVVNLA